MKPIRSATSSSCSSASNSTTSPATATTVSSSSSSASSFNSTAISSSSVPSLSSTVATTASSSNSTAATAVASSAPLIPTPAAVFSSTPSLSSGSAAASKSASHPRPADDGEFFVAPKRFRSSDQNAANRVPERQIFDAFPLGSQEEIKKAASTAREEDIQRIVPEEEARRELAASETGEADDLHDDAHFAPMELESSFPIPEKQKGKETEQIAEAVFSSTSSAPAAVSSVTTDSGSSSAPPLPSIPAAGFEAASDPPPDGDLFPTRLRFKDPNQANRRVVPHPEIYETLPPAYQIKIRNASTYREEMQKITREENTLRKLAASQQGLQDNNNWAGEQDDLHDAYFESLERESSFPYRP